MTFVRPKFGTLARAAAAVAVAAVLLTASPHGLAKSGGGYVKIEQDWELVVSTPDPTRCSPQIYAQLYPEEGGTYCCQFLINYNDQPAFLAGGVQIQVWQNEFVLDGRDNAPEQAVLVNNNEVVTFTLAMEIKDGKLSFSASNVSCESWGDVSRLAVAVPYTPTEFSNYRTRATVNNSGILLGSNRVTSLKIKEVRKFDASGELTTLGERQIYPPPSP